MKRIVIALALLALCLAQGAAESGSVPGRPFPDFSAADTQGNTFSLSETLMDHQAVLITFWTARSPLCGAEMAILNEAYERYGSRAAFIALSCDGGDTMEEIEASPRCGLCHGAGRGRPFASIPWGRKRSPHGDR